MIYYLKLVRWPNLVMIVITQILLRFSIIEPILFSTGKIPLLTDFDFFILVLSCVCIAAGGYIINDIEDINIDRINKPSKLIITKHISNEAAYNLYIALTFIGIIAGFYLNFSKHYQYIAVINLVVAGMLYFYSTTYKCIPLLGNFIISLITAFSLIIVILPEPSARANQLLISVFTTYALFSFVLTMVRELIKDMQDIEGDASCGCNTLPISVGTAITKSIAAFFTISVIVVLVWIQIKSKAQLSIGLFLYLLIFIEIPLLILVWQIIKAKNNNEFGRASFNSKLIMFTGIISMIIFYFSF